jgi:hypothetical protein
MADNKKRRIDWLLILPGSLLLIEIIFVVVLLVTDYQITQPMMFFLILLGIFLIFQIWRQFSTRLRVQRSVAKLDEAKSLVDSGKPFEAISLWKQLLLSLPRDKYLDVLTMLQETYANQDMQKAVQQVKAVRSESLNFFELTKNAQKATAKDRKDWQARALELRKMIKALPTEPDQSLSESLEE